MSKKILSLALAVVMLFSICAVAVSAVQGDGSENIRIYMTSDATVGAPAGTVVNVSYYVDLPDGIDELQMAIGNIAIGWDNTAYKVNSTQTTNAADARTWGDDFGQYMKSTAAVTVSSTISTNILKKANANDTAKGFNQACQVQMVYDGSNATASGGFPIYDNQHIFTLQFVALKTLTANDVIGVVEGAYGQSFFKVCWHNGSGATAYAASNVDMTDAAGVAPAAPAFDVYHVAAANGDAKTRTNADDASKYDIGVKFGFKAATIAPDFNANGTSDNIQAITATVTANLAAGGTSTVTAEAIRFIYDLSGGAKTEFGFNVIIAGIPNGDTAITSYTITPSITTADGNTYTCETKTINVADLKFA